MRIFNRLVLICAVAILLFWLYGMVHPSLSPKAERNLKISAQCNEWNEDASSAKERRQIREVCDRMKATEYEPSKIVYQYTPK